MILAGWVADPFLGAGRIGRYAAEAVEAPRIKSGATMTDLMTNLLNILLDVITAFIDEIY